MDDLLDTLHATRTLWLPSIVLILSATAFVGPDRLGRLFHLRRNADAARFSW
jgi:hypothetical protein